jgi:hypothetical protein
MRIRIFEFWTLVVQHHGDLHASDRTGGGPTAANAQPAHARFVSRAHAGSGADSPPMRCGLPRPPCAIAQPGARPAGPPTLPHRLFRRSRGAMRPLRTPAVCLSLLSYGKFSLMGSAVCQKGAQRWRRALSTLHYDLAFSRAISRSDGLNDPL